MARLHAVASFVARRGGAAAVQAIAIGGLEAMGVTEWKRVENLQSVVLSMTSCGGVAPAPKAIGTLFDRAARAPDPAPAAAGGCQRPASAVIADSSNPDVIDSRWGTPPRSVAVGRFSPMLRVGP